MKFELKLEGNLDKVELFGKLAEVLLDLSDGKRAGTWYSDRFTGHYKLVDIKLQSGQQAKIVSDDEWNGLEVLVVQRGRIDDPKWGIEDDPEGDVFYVEPLTDRPDGCGREKFVMGDELGFVLEPIEQKG